MFFQSAGTAGEGHVVMDSSLRHPLFRSLPWCAFVFLTFMLCMTRYADYDLWWHLKLGESVLHDGRIPCIDTFSYSCSGKPQYCGEWLADAVIYLSFKAGGFWGINLLKAAIVLAVCHCLAATFRIRLEGRKGWWLASIVTLVLLLFAIRFRLFVRPYLFTMLFSALFLLLSERWRSGSRDRAIWLLPLAMLFWSNMSVGAVFGLLILGMAVAAELMETRSARLLPVFGAVAAVSFANPEGWRIYSMAFDLASDPYRALIGEYQPLTRDILWGSGFSYTVWFQVMALCAIVYFIFLNGWRNIFHLGLFAFFLCESILQVRMIETFSIIAAPLCASALFPLTARVEAALADRPLFLPLIVAGIISAIVPVALLGSTVYTFGVGPKEGSFPEGAIRFLEREGITGRMFNSYGYGGYLAWRAPGREVFIDGRYRRIYEPSHYGEYTAIMSDATAWKQGEERYGFDYAVLEYDFMSRRFPVHLLDNPDWALVYWDNTSTVFVKRTPARQRIISLYEYRVAQPRFLDFSYLDHHLKGGLKDALDQLDREVSRNRDNQFAALARTYLLYPLGPQAHRLMEQELWRIMPMKPDFAAKHSALAIVLYDRGNKLQARIQVEQALRMDPFDPAALSLAKDLGIPVKPAKTGIPGHP